MEQHAGCPTDLTTTIDRDGCVVFSWSPLNGARSYRVWIAGERSLVSSTTSVRFSLAAGRDVDFKVRGEMIDGRMSEIATLPYRHSPAAISQAAARERVTEKREERKRRQEANAALNPTWGMF